MKKLMDMVTQPAPPLEMTAAKDVQGAPLAPSATQAWLRRVAFLLAAAGPLLGCGGASEPVDVCEAWSSKMVTCNTYYAGYTQQQLEQYCHYYMDYYVDYYGAQCGAAAEDYYACLSHLSCAAIENDILDACNSQAITREQECGF